MRLHLVFTAVFVLGAFLACWPMPEELAPPCISELESELIDERAPGTPARCEAFIRQEQVTRAAYEDATSLSAEQIRDGMRRQTCVVRADTKWSDKYQRRFFTDEDSRGWMLWGLTRCRERRIELADDHFESGVLPHEYGHAIDRCETSHEWQNQRGYSVAVAQVCTVALADTQSLMFRTDDEPIYADGVYDPEEAAL